MTAHYGLILDSLIVVLLIATIVYAAMLNRRLAGLRDNRRELEQAGAQLQRSRRACRRRDQGPQARRRGDRPAPAEGRRPGEALKDELTFLVETAEALCARLEAGRRRAACREAGRGVRGGPRAGRRRPAPGRRPRRRRRALPDWR